MNSFGDLNIKPTQSAFTGDKISIQNLLNTLIVVQDYKIEKSKFEKGSGQRLVLQLTKNGEQRVLFSGSTVLMDMITQVPRSSFPFTTTIQLENKSLKFT